MKILDRYILRMFISTFSVVLLFILGLFVILNVFSRVDDLIEIREELAELGLTVSGVLARYYLVSLPFFFQQLLPFTTLIAATIALSRLIRGNELTPMVSAGLSSTRIAMPIYIAGGLFVLASLAMQEWGLPRLASSRIRLDLLTRGEIEGDIDDVPPISDDAGNTWSIELYYPLDQRIEGVEVLRFRDPETGEHLGSIAIDRAHYLADGAAGPGWYPEGGGAFYAADGAAAFGQVTDLSPDIPLATDLLPAEIVLEVARRSRESGNMLSISEAAQMVKRFPDLPRQAVVFHSLITWPLANLLLLLLGLPLIFRMAERNPFIGVGISLTVCAAFFFANTLCQDLGNRAALPPAVAAWLPIVAFTSLAIALRDALRV